MTFVPTAAVRARRAAPAAAAVCVCALLFGVRAASAIPRGLRGDYFSNSALAGVPLFSQLDTDISTAHLASAWRADVPSAFSVRWRGYLAVPRHGSYEFATTSDEGSRLFIDGQLVVDNGGTHAAFTRSGRATLDSGPHAILLEYVQTGGAYALEWSWARDGQRAHRIPGWLLSPARTSYGRALALRALDWAAWLSVIAAAVVVVMALGMSRVRAAADSLRRPAVAALGLFIALAIVETWPLARDPAHLSRNDNADTIYCEWAIAWVAHQAPRAPRHLFDANIFYPERDTLAYSETLLPQAALGAPLLWLGASPVLTFNVLLIAGYALTGWVMCLVLARWTGDWVAAIAGGITIGFSAHTLSRMPHLQAQHDEFLPLALLALDSVLERPNVRNALALAGWFALQALTSFYLLVMTTVACAAGVVVRPRAWTGAGRTRVAIALALAAVAATAVLLPLLWPYYTLASQQTGFTRPLAEASIYAAAWRDYLTTPARIPGALFRATMSGGSALYPGAVAVALAAVAIATGTAFRDPRARMCLAFGVCGLLLSFGPKIPGYAVLYNAVPLLRGVRAVSRFGYLALVSVAALSAYGFARVRRWMDHIGVPRGVAAAVALGVLLLALLDTLASPIGYTPYEGVPRIYDRLAGAARAVVIEVPMYPARIIYGNAPYELNSTVHWQPLIDGYSGFVPSSFNAHVDAATGFPSAASIAALRRIGVSLVVAHRDQLPETVRRALAAAPLTRLAEQGAIAVYSLDARPETEP